MVQFSLVITVVLSLMLLMVVAPPAAAQALRKQALVTGGARSALSSVGLAGPFVFITEGYQDMTEWDGNHRKNGIPVSIVLLFPQSVSVWTACSNFVCASLRSLPRLSIRISHRVHFSVSSLARLPKSK